MFLSATLMRRASVNRLDLPTEKQLPKQMSETEKEALDIAMRRVAFKRYVSTLKNCV